MGCAGSRFDEMPVTGHESGLAIIPTSDNRYVRSEITVLKLREKFFSFSGDDCSVKVRKMLFLHTRCCNTAGIRFLHVLLYESF